jgi:hypothetical protein
VQVVLCLIAKTEQSTADTAMSGALTIIGEPHHVIHEKQTKTRLLFPNPGSELIFFKQRLINQTYQFFSTKEWS